MRKFIVTFERHQESRVRVLATNPDQAARIARDIAFDDDDTRVDTDYEHVTSVKGVEFADNVEGDFLGDEEEE